MRNLISTMTISRAAMLAGAFLFLGAAPGFAAPKIEPVQAKIDFGSVSQGADAPFEFVLRNTGDEPLKIEQVKPSCGCTAALVDDDVVPPGGEARITGTVKTVGFQDRITKTITVTSNDPNRARVTLTITGLVEVPFHLEPRYVNFGQVTLGEAAERTAVLTVKDESKLPVTLGEVTAKNPYVSVSVEPDEAGTSFTFTVRLAADAPQGVISTPIEIPVQGEAKPLRLSLYANVVGSVALYPQTVSLGLLEADKTVVRNFVVMSPTGADFEVVEAVCDLPGCTTAIEPLNTTPPRVRITLTLNGAGLEPGRVEGTLTVKTSAPGNPELTAKLLGSVQALSATPAETPATPGAE